MIFPLSLEYFSNSFIISQCKIIPLNHISVNICITYDGWLGQLKEQRVNIRAMTELFEPAPALLIIQISELQVDGLQITGKSHFSQTINVFPFRIDIWKKLNSLLFGYISIYRCLALQSKISDRNFVLMYIFRIQM